MCLRARVSKRVCACVFGDSCPNYACRTKTNARRPSGANTTARRVIVVARRRKRRRSKLCEFRWLAVISARAQVQISNARARTVSARVSQQDIGGCVKVETPGRDVAARDPPGLRVSCARPFRPGKRDANDLRAATISDVSDRRAITRQSAITL